MKRLLLLIFFLNIVVSTSATQPFTNLPSTPDAHETIKHLTETRNKLAAESERWHQQRETSLKQLEDQLTILSQQKDRGTIGEAEYQQQKATIEAKIVTTREEIKRAMRTGEKIDDVILHVFGTGWDTLINGQQEQERRKTLVAQAAVTQDIKNEGELARLRMMLEPENLTKVVTYGTLGAAGVVGVYYLWKLFYRYLEINWLEKAPALVHETSFQGRYADFKEYVLALFNITPPPPPSFDEEIIFEPKLEEKLKTIVTSAKILHERGLPIPSMLLYGPPGTGKTWYAKLLAKASGLRYALTSADRFSQFEEGKDVQAVHDLFDWAEQCKEGIVLFFDEIDALGAHRDKLSERWIRLLNAFLARTGTNVPNIVIVVATNRIQALDPAFLNRFPQKINIPLPGPKERERLFALYLKKYIINEKRTIMRNNQEVALQLTIAPDVTDAIITQAANRTNGLSGRQIEQMLNEMRKRCYLTDNLQLTKAIFTDVVEQMVTQEQHF